MKLKSFFYTEQKTPSLKQSGSLQNGGKSLINYVSVKRLISIIKNRKTEHQENSPIKNWNTELNRVLIRGNTNDILNVFKVSNIISHQGNEN